MYPLWQASRSFLCVPTSLLSWGPVNVVHSGKWHIKEWSTKAFRQKSFAQPCSLLNKMEMQQWEVHLLSVLVETQALTHGIMCLIIYTGLSANNAWVSHWSTFCHLWKSWQEAPLVSGTSGVLSPGCCLKKSFPLTDIMHLCCHGWRAISFFFVFTSLLLRASAYMLLLGWWL